MPRSEFHVRVRTLTGEVTVTLQPDDTCARLKQIVSIPGKLGNVDATGKRVRVIYLGKELQDEEILSDKVQPGTVLHVVLSNIVENEKHRSQQTIGTFIDPESQMAADRRIATRLQFGENRQRRHAMGFTEEVNQVSVPAPGEPSAFGGWLDVWFLTGVLLGFTVGFIMLFWLGEQSLSSRHKSGILVGVSLNLLLSMHD